MLPGAVQVLTRSTWCGTMLSIGVSTWQSGDIRPSAILKIESRVADIGPLLEQPPTNRDLHSLDEDEFKSLMGPGSPGVELYYLLRRQVGLPRIATHKLFARKRPRLAPIRGLNRPGIRGGSRPWKRGWSHVR
jgi:hypothetical protein